MAYLKQILITLFIAVFLTGCATKTTELSSSIVLEKYSSVNELNSLLKQAEVAGTDYLAPEGFRKAQQLYEKAFDWASKQKPGANQLAENGLVHLRSAMQHAETSRTVLAEVLGARDYASKAGAKIIFPDEFSDLEDKLQDATNAIEEGFVEQAKKLRAGLMNDYTALEIASLKVNITKQAKASIASADLKDADKFAPKTFKLAQEELALALDVLNAGRAQTENSQGHAEQAVYYAKKSMFITDMVRNFERRKFTPEDKILWYQQQLEIVNEPFKKALSFDQPNFDVVLSLQKRIEDWGYKYISSEQSLDEANKTIISLQGSIGMIKSEHQDEVSGLSKKLQRDTASMQKQLQIEKENNRKAQARYNKIQSLFTEDEAYVYRQKNNVLLETHAFNFKVGNSEIDSSNYPLLEKIIEAVNTFENPDVMIMGHTDSTGSASLNQSLSQKRAESVASFLQKLGKIKANNIETKGYGETRPVASNETREGRERNRRIEVLIINN